MRKNNVTPSKKTTQVIRVYESPDRSCRISVRRLETVVVSFFRWNIVGYNCWIVSRAMQNKITTVGASARWLLWVFSDPGDLEAVCSRAWPTIFLKLAKFVNRCYRFSNSGVSAEITKRTWPDLWTGRPTSSWGLVEVAPVASGAIGASRRL